MKLMSCSHVDIINLLGSMIVNPGGACYHITGISLSLDDFTPWIHIKSVDSDEATQAIPFDDSLKDWSIQIGSCLYE